MRGLMAASFVWRRLAVRCAPPPGLPASVLGSISAGVLGHRGPGAFRHGRPRFPSGKFCDAEISGRIGRGEEGEGGRGRCVRTGAGLGGDASHPARPLLSLRPGSGRGAPNPAPRAFPRRKGGPSWHHPEAKCPEYGNSFVVDLLPLLKYNWYR